MSCYSATQKGSQCMVKIGFIDFREKETCFAFQSDKKWDWREFCEKIIFSQRSINLFNTKCIKSLRNSLQIFPHHHYPFINFIKDELYVKGIIDEIY